MARTKQYNKLTAAEVRHSTGTVPALVTPELTQEDLFGAMNRLYDIEENEVREVLRKHGYTNYKPSEWFAYFDAVREHRKMQAAQKAWPGTCPVCQSEIERDATKDEKFYVMWGWNCVKNSSHFFEVFTLKVRENFETMKENSTWMMSLDM